MLHTKTFAIVGGGIGGLTLAIALQRKGFTVQVFEQASEIKPIGAGIVLAANAMKALAAIGLSQNVVAAGKQLKRFCIRDDHGKLISQTDADMISAKYGAVNTLSLHRADLHQTLIENLAPGTLFLNKTCNTFEQGADGITLHFKDGTKASADFLIAADGIRSVVREALIPQHTLRYSGYTCWRGILPVLPDTNSDEASEWWGSGKRFGIVPLTGDRIYWYATYNAASNDKNLLQLKSESVARLFDDFADPVKRIIRATGEKELIKNDISDIEPLKKFAFGKVVLLGDAAHATTPNLGQGACMAIEDAAVLSGLLSSIPNPEEAFKAFERIRIPRTTQIVKTSHTLGKIGQLKNPLLVRLRNAAMRLAPSSAAEKQLKFLYDVSFK